VYRLKTYEIPLTSRQAMGTAIVNLLNLQPNEKIQAIVTTTDFPKDKFLVFATANGTVKKTAFSEYDKSRREGWIAINLREGDEVVRVVATSGSDDLMVVTFRGMSIRFNEEEVREVGRDSMGVRGIKLRDDDKAISLDVVRPDADLFLVTDTGFGATVFGASNVLMLSILGAASVWPSALVAVAPGTVMENSAGLLASMLVSASQILPFLSLAAIASTRGSLKSPKV